MDTVDHERWAVIVSIVPYRSRNSVPIVPTRKGFRRSLFDRGRIEGLAVVFEYRLSELLVPFVPSIPADPLRGLASGTVHPLLDRVDGSLRVFGPSFTSSAARSIISSRFRGSSRFPRRVSSLGRRPR